MRRRRKKIFSGVALAFAVAAFAVPAAEAKPISAPATASYTQQQLRALELRSQGMNERHGTTAAAGLTPQRLQEELRFQGVDKRQGLVGRTTSTVQSSSAPAAASVTRQQLQDELRFQGVDKRHGLIGRTTNTVQSSSAPVLASSTDDFSWGAGFAGAGGVVAAAIILVAGFTAMRRRAHPLGV